MIFRGAIFVLKVIMALFFLFFFSKFVKNSSEADYVVVFEIVSFLELVQAHPL